MAFTYTIQPLGTEALLVDFGDTLLPDAHKLVLQLNNKIHEELWQGITETIPAYTSLAVFYNIDIILKYNIASKNTTAYDCVKRKIEHLVQLNNTKQLKNEERLLKIPVCYDMAFAPDLKDLAAAKNVSVDEVIHIHSSKVYDIYMIGFLPGFPYMGEVDEIITFNRKSQPVNVTKGSVGIAGRQTGIYPLDSPGGWQIIGRTPLTIFDPLKREPSFFKVGDKVQFYSIDKNEFENYQERNI